MAYTKAPGSIDSGGRKRARVEQCWNGFYIDRLPVDVECIVVSSCFHFLDYARKTPCSYIWRQSKRSAKHEHLNSWIFYFSLNFCSTFCRLAYIFISYVIYFFCNQLQPQALAKPVPRLKRTDGKRKERKNAFLSVCNLKIELKFLWCVEKRFQLLVRYFHFLSSPRRCKNQIKAQQCLRNSHLRDEKFTHELIIIFDDIAAQDVCQHVNGKFTSFKPEP